MEQILRDENTTGDQMKTFNDKPMWRNLVAIVLGITGLYVLLMAWFFHMVVQLFTMPKEKWIDPFAVENFPPYKEYSHPVCSFLCNSENALIHQLELLRAGFGKEYCGEDDDA